MTYCQFDPRATNICKMWSKIHFSYKKTNLKMVATCILCRPQCVKRFCIDLQDPEKLCGTWIFSFYCFQMRFNLFEIRITEMHAFQHDETPHNWIMEYSITVEVSHSLCLGLMSPVSGEWAEGSVIFSFSDLRACDTLGECESCDACKWIHITL